MHYTLSILQPFISVSDGVSSFAVKYNFYSNGNKHTFACPEKEGVLECSVDAASFRCPPSTKINVSLSALNGLGQGPISDPTIIGTLILILVLPKYAVVSHRGLMHVQITCFAGSDMSQTSHLHVHVE